MTAFPLFVELEKKPCLVIGGGRVALRKVRTLLKFGADVTVVAKDISEEMQKLADDGQIKYILKNVLHMTDLEYMLRSYFIVICATDDAALNHQICELCKLQNIWVNSATEKADSTFIFPAVVVRGNVSVGVSSSEGAPSLTRHVRTKIDEMLPEWYGDFEVRLAELRKMAMQILPTQAQRSAYMTAVTAYGAAHEGEISEAVAEEIMKQIISQC